ncbi:MAG TPA: DUF4328 domain-containing protein, partial [Acidimicrobiia bacterium]|nr:DUF4328 domain-containing protein [Acidimicrobiia bacterium]
MTTHEHWRSTTGLRTALVWLLSINVATTVAAGIAVLHNNQVVDDYNHLRTNYAATESARRLVGVAGLAFGAVLLATVVVFIVWMWRSAKNNELLDRVRPRYTAGWSIGGWFIPIGNLWIPVRIMHDLWQGSDPATQRHEDWRVLRRTPLIGWWWGFYLASRILTFTPVGVVCSVPAAVLAIVVVRRITERQLEARDLAPALASGWYADPTGRFDHRYWNGRA